MVAAEIRKMIVNGVLRPGERIRQDDITTALGVSRIPVREAVIALDREGWVTIEPRRGAYVLGIDVDYVRDHFDIVAEIWGLVAARAAKESEPEEISRLCGLAGSMKASRSGAEYAAASRELMNELLGIGGSGSVASVLDLMTGIVSDTDVAEAANSADLGQHIDALITSLRSGDSFGAGESMASVIQAMGTAVVAALRDRDNASSSRSAR